MNELAPLDAWCNGLIARLAPPARRALARELARRLRESQSARIAAQQNPDGSAYAPRKVQTKARLKRGAVRRKMFTKIRTAKWLKLEATPERAVIAFTGQVQRMAQVHQYGLRDRVSRRSKLEVKYPERKLLGFTAADVDLVGELMLDHLAGRP
ncbi:MAG: phage virion morphogenesis protein [Georgfuchsia sp.]